MADKLIFEDNVKLQLILGNGNLEHGEDLAFIIRGIKRLAVMLSNLDENELGKSPDIMAFLELNITDYTYPGVSLGIKNYCTMEQEQFEIPFNEKEWVMFVHFINTIDKTLKIEDSDNIQQGK